MNKWSVFLLMLVGLMSAPTAYADNFHWKEPAFIQQAFMEVALRNEYSTEKQAIRKWSKPITIWIEHKVPDVQKHAAILEMHIKHLSQLTGHPIRLVSSKEQANVIFVFTRHAIWDEDVERVLGKSSLKHIRDAVCMASFKINQHKEIISAGIVIPVNQANARGKLLACIVEEITQVMGLPNDSDKVYPSIFNDHSPEDLLSPLDGLLLKILYHPSLHIGMSEAEAMPIVRKIIASFVRNGTLDNAIRDIRAGELYPYLGY
jgi:hypothetical protein